MELCKELGLVSLTTLLSLSVMFLLTKLMGAKQVSQMTMFDYVEGITIGSVAAELATDLETPLHTLTALVLYGVAAVGISLWSNHSLAVRRFFAGKPLILLENGVLYRENLKKAKLDLNEFLTYCRIAGWFDLNQIQTAILENNGIVSFLPKETDRPATPADLGKTPKKTVVQTPFIMDGRLLTGNLRQAGKEPEWVRRILLRQGYGDERAVFLALWDGGEQLTVFPMEPPKPENQVERL